MKSLMIFVFAMCLVGCNDGSMKSESTLFKSWTNSRIEDSNGVRVGATITISSTRYTFAFTEAGASQPSICDCALAIAGSETAGTATTSSCVPQGNAYAGLCNGLQATVNYTCDGRTLVFNGSATDTWTAL